MSTTSRGGYAAGLLCLLLLGGLTRPGTAGSLPVPQGLKAGDRYYLAFLTKDQIAGDNTDIKTYNDFVNAQANQKDSKAKGTTWRAIVSTATVNAKDNVDFANQSNIAPIYLLDGKSLVVKQAQDLFSEMDLLHAINIDQFAQSSAARNVWTGSNRDGTKSDFPLGGSPVTTGDPQEVGRFWINRGAAVSRFPDHVYAVSRLLTVVPEPSSWILMGAGLALSLGVVRTRRSR